MTTEEREQEKQQNIARLLGYSYKTPEIAELDQQYLTRQRKSVLTVMKQASGYAKSKKSSSVVQNEAGAFLVKCVYDPDNPCHEEAGNIFFQTIEKYIHSEIHNTFNTYVSTGNDQKNRENRDSFVSSAMLDVMTCLYKYDPGKGALTTHIARPVRHGITRVIDENNNMSSHYNKLVRRVVRARETIEKRGETVTMTALRNELPDMTMEFIRTGLEYEMYLSTADIDETSEDARSEDYRTPYEVITEKDQTGQLFDIADQVLTKEERYILGHLLAIDFDNRTNTIDKKVSPASLAKSMGLSPQELNRRRSIAQQKIRNALEKIEQPAYSFDDIHEKECTRGNNTLKNHIQFIEDDDDETNILMELFGRAVQVLDLDADPDEKEIIEF